MNSVVMDDVNNAFEEALAAGQEDTSTKDPGKDHSGKMDKNSFEIHVV